MRSIRWVAETLNAPIERADPSRTVTGVAVDSRNVAPGDLFVALPGRRTDGHRFLEEAFRRGAAGALLAQVPPDTSAVNRVVVDDPLQALGQLAARRRAELAIPIVGITGSAGKTTTKELLSAMLGRCRSVHCSPGNHNTEISLPMALLNTPEDAEVAVFEMGLQYPGDIQDLSAIARPTHGILTSIGQAHIAHFPSPEALAREKWALPANLPPEGQAVLNRDAPFVADWLDGLPCSSTTFSVEDPDADLRPSRLDETSLDGLKLTVEAGSERVQATTPLVGRANAYPILAAMAMARVLETPWSEILKALEAFQPPDQRMRRLHSPRFGTLLDDSYNASPAATRLAVTTLARIRTSARKVAVLGDMRELGDRSRRCHEQIAETLQDHAGALDRVYTIGDEMRTIADTLRNVHGWMPVHARHEATIASLKARLARELPDAENLILVKGSRAMGLDRLVEELVATPFPSDASEIAPDDGP